MELLGRGKRKLQGVEFKVGDVLDQRYLVMNIRRGYMGIVYLARDLHGDEIVALKTFQRKFTWIPEAIENFNREAEVWMRLGSHPNIVQARRILQISGRPHIVMEFVNGQALRELAKTLTISHIIDLLIQVCWAMQYAYDRSGIVHRDLKPDNVMVTTEGRAKVTDFGLAQVVRRGGPGSRMVEVKSEARDLFRGSESYMSPEQRVADGKIGPWSDIYSTGVMFFELLTGRLPFVSSDFDELRRLHLEAPPPNPRSIVHELPTGCEHVVLRCLQKDLDKRYRSFNELERDLQLVRKHGYGAPLERPSDVVAMSEALDAYQRGIAHFSLAEYPEALRYFRRGVELEPDRADFLMQLGSTLMAMLRYDDALRSFEQAAQLKLSHDEQAELWLLRGKAHEQLYQLPEAARAYSQMLSLDKRYREAWAGLGRVFCTLALYREAIEAYDAAIKLDSHDPRLWCGRALVERTVGQPKQALHSYDQALHLNPRELAAWLGKANCLFDLKRYQDALSCYRMARSIDPESQAAHGGVLECKKILGILPQG